VLWGRDLARRYLCDIERVLRPKRALLVLDYSYSGDVERDRRDFVRAP
jgi:hypothetical protein